GFGIIAASHPQQTIEVDSSGLCRVRVQHVAGIYHSAEFSSASGGGEGGQKQGGAPRGSGAADFGQASAGHAASQGVDGGDAAGDHLRRWTNIKPGSRGDVRQPGVGGGEFGGQIGAADTLGRTRLGGRLVLWLKRQRHFWNCFGIKDKRAAQGRRRGNHCGRHKILEDFRERRGWSRGGSFAFYSPCVILRLRAFPCQDAGKIYFPNEPNVDRLGTDLRRKRLRNLMNSIASRMF